MAAIPTRFKVIGIAGVLLVLLAVGMRTRGPMPEILLPAEKLLQVGPFPLVNTITAAWLTILVLVGTSLLVRQRLQLVPGRLQNVVEAGLEAMLEFVVGIAGEENGRRFFPLVATIFLFVMISAWLALLPGFNSIGKVESGGHGAVELEQVDVGPAKVALLMPGAKEAEAEESAPHGGAGVGHDGAAEEEGVLGGVIVPFLRSANTDINTPLALAIMSAIFVEYWGIRALGLVGYGSKFFNFGGVLRARSFGALLSGFVDVFVGLIELMSEFARLISFTFRLFGNMFAGEVLLLIIGFLIPWVAVLPFFGLEIFVGFVQALVFAGLTLVFATMAVAGHGEAEHH